MVKEYLSRFSLNRFICLCCFLIGVLKLYCCIANGRGGAWTLGRLCGISGGGDRAVVSMVSVLGKGGTLGGGTLGEAPWGGTLQDSGLVEGTNLREV